VLFATEAGLKEIRAKTIFDSVDAVFKLDESYKCFARDSRYFIENNPAVERESCKKMCLSYGTRLWDRHPLGYEDGQLLIGFHHNTPDNTLPIICYCEPDGPPCKAIFRRYPKKYGWDLS
jgi:hypothetical protein